MVSGLGTGLGASFAWVWILVKSWNPLCDLWQATECRYRKVSLVHVIRFPTIQDYSVIFFTGISWDGALPTVCVTIRNSSKQLFSCLCFIPKLVKTNWFPNVQTEPPPVQLCAVPMCPAVGSQGEDSSASLSTSPPQEVAESNEVYFLTINKKNKLLPLFKYKRFLVVCRIPPVHTKSKWTHGSYLCRMVYNCRCVFFLWATVCVVIVVNVWTQRVGTYYSPRICRAIQLTRCSNLGKTELLSRCHWLR